MFAAVVVFDAFRVKTFLSFVAINRIKRYQNISYFDWNICTTYNFNSTFKNRMFCNLFEGTNSRQHCHESNYGNNLNTHEIKLHFIPQIEVSNSVLCL